MAEINITPFTDVILVLLIIFMITTPLIYQSSLKITLPTASTKDPLEQNKPIYITVTRDGLIYVGKDLVTHQELKAKISALLKKDRSLGVVLFSDELVRFKEVIGVIDILNELGVKTLNMATKSSH